jgi:hypothetical protein
METIVIAAAQATAGTLAEASVAAMLPASARAYIHAIGATTSAIRKTSNAIFFAKIKNILA